MKIAIIGAGNVGGALGAAWSKGDHDVVFAVREPDGERTRALLAELGGRARATHVIEAVAAADVVVLATPWPATEAALRAAGDMTGKVLLDCTNPLAADLSGLTHGHTTSGGELVAQWARGARVVKIFNTTGSDNMADPDYGGTPVTMLYAGDDEQANAVAAELASELGFAPVRLGPLSAARLLEPFALTWITLAFRGGLGRGFALQIVRRP
ncbi:MAG: NAD(P)-binding domain-containing protein [Planctomycetes bacterium]|nr:NAD(P)-binding domain-containing protein [Planctomycetota bacterium]